MADIVLKECKKCGLISDNILYSDEYLTKIYETLYSADEYSGHVKEHQQLLKGEKPLLGWHKKVILNWIKKNTDNSKNIDVFEFGAGIGLVASHYKDIPNVNYTGIEFDENAMKLAKERGCNVTRNSITAQFDENMKFDFVISFEVIEHISDIKAAFDNMFKLLKKDGYLLFSVPNFDRSKNDGDNKLHQIKPPVHINFFTKNNIKKIGAFYNKKVIGVYERPYPFISSPKMHWIKTLLGTYHGTTLVAIIQNN